MIRSMTGFGQADRTAGGFRIRVEVKSVNHRYAEISVKMPREWMSAEDAVRKQVSREVKRGRVDVFIIVEREALSGRKVELDWELAGSYMEAAGLLKQRLGLQDELTLRDVLQLPDVLRVTEGTEQEAAGQATELLLASVEEAVTGLLAMRAAEGSHLREDLDRRLGILAEHHAAAKSVAPRVAAEYRHKLASRLQELLGQTPMDENRLAMELAVFADRCSIDEELIRLDSHFSQFAQLLHSDEPAGRKLDFLIQEMNREINTIGSKANQAELSALVVEMKAELEKIREQVQNIE